MRQIVAHKKMGALSGLLLILALAALLMLMNFFAIHVLARWIGFTAAGVTFWLGGACAAIWALRVYVARAQYALSEDVLRLSWLYGKKERAIADIYLSRLLFVGTKEEALARYPKLRKISVLHPSNQLPVTALVYRDSEGTRMALIQADDALRNALVQRAKAR